MTKTHTWRNIRYAILDGFKSSPVMEMKSWREHIRELREDHDLTQRDIAALLGTTQQVYSRYEQGVIELPIRHLITLCRFYKVESDYILGLSEQQTKAE